MTIKEELITMLNQALRLEHAARIQYMTHATLVKGLYAEKIIERLEELAGDEKKHEEAFRNMIVNYLDGEPTMELDETKKATEVKDILEINLKKEKEAVDFYQQIYKKLMDNKDKLPPYSFATLEHELRHVIIDEQEHIVELSTLLGI